MREHRGANALLAPPLLWVEGFKKKKRFVSSAQRAESQQQMLAVHVVSIFNAYLLNSSSEVALVDGRMMKLPWHHLS